MESRKYWGNYFHSSNGHTDIEDRLVDTVMGGGGRASRGWDVWKSNMETASPHVKQIANGNLLCGSGNSNQSSVPT